MNSLRQDHGFTLIELSIVLVIIGLVVGGILVGQDLIRAAQHRKIISEVENYTTAVYTFKSKYNVFPAIARMPSLFGAPLFPTLTIWLPVWVISCLALMLIVPATAAGMVGFLIIGNIRWLGSI